MLKLPIKHTTYWRPGRLAYNTAHASGWNIARVSLQAGSLVLMARLFGASGYGALAGTVAFYITFAQFTGLGSGVALVRHIARAGELHAKLASTQQVYLVTSALLFTMIWPLSIVVLNGILTPATLACFAAAELVIVPMLMPLAYRYQAEERMLLSGAMLTLAPFSRFGAVTTAFLLGIHDLATFAIIYLSWLVVIVALGLHLTWPIKTGGLKRPSLIATIRDGLPYLVSGATTTAGGELDKTIILRISGNVVAGQYSAAYRIMQAITLPVNSLIMAASARMFRSTAHNNERSRFTWLLFLAVFGYALIAAIVLWLIAPLIPILLGSGFWGSEIIVRWISILVVTTCVRQLVTAQLTTLDLQRNRNIIEVGGLFLSLSLLVTLVPRIGVFGAIISLMAADIFVIILGFAQTRKRYQNENGH